MATDLQHFGKYELRKLLAHGGMGEVWQAFDMQLQRYVAIKMLRPVLQDDPEFVERFKREAQLIASLHHPHIVQIHDFQISEAPETESTLVYMIMDYVQGPTLAQFLRKTSHRKQFPSPSDIIYILTGTSLALDFAHRRGLVHRDIKPSNILLDQRPPLTNPIGKPVLIDFGIARLQGANSATAAGALIGTPQYISPEQARGRECDHVSDLYALGIILYEMMTGEAPFRGSSTVSIIMQHINEPATPPHMVNPAISLELSEVILKSIAKKPSDRFQSASEMTIAAARALNVPVPTSLLKSGSPSQGGIVSPSLSLPSPEMATMPWSPPTIHLEDAAAVNPQRTEPVTPTQPEPQISPAQMLPLSSPTLTPPVQSAAPIRKHVSLRSRPLVLIGLFLCIFALSSGVALWYFANSGANKTTVTVNGQVTFSHSSHNTQNGDDTVQIDVRNLPTLSPGETYYAWIETGASESFRPHWPLAVHGGSVQTRKLTYPGYHNLLRADSILLITIENSGTDPLLPNVELSNRVAYAPLQPGQNTVFTIQQCPPISQSNICLS
ncbi:MAG TPA: protein kinase [Ktedonobacteraceae bacterium]